MAETGAPKFAPQFQTAEYSPSPSGDVCRSCNQPIGKEYYRVNGAMTCETCALQAAQNLPKDSSGDFAKAVVFGMGGALLGFVLYAAFEIATGWIIGYISLAVGWLVGTAMMKATGGVGGKKYQIVAAVLVYVAVAMSIIPVALWQSKVQITPALLIGLPMMGIISPFWRLRFGFGAVIGLFILLIGMQIAWRITAGTIKLAVEGPYKNA